MARVASSSATMAAFPCQALIDTATAEVVHAKHHEGPLSRTRMLETDVGGLGTDPTSASPAGCSHGSCTSMSAAAGHKNSDSLLGRLPGIDGWPDGQHRSVVKPADLANLD